jgi:hypothetical protein
MTRLRDSLHNNMLIAAGSVAAVTWIFFSVPFLKIPYDMWEHLIRIASFHDEGQSFIFWPEDRVYAMYHWHLAWGYFFRLISVNDIFTWAKIIHVFQSTLSWICMVFFCSTFIRLALPDINKVERQLYILLSVLLWFIGNGTFSMPYQQAWIVWYSVSYQAMAFPLYWFITALSMCILYDDAVSSRWKIVALSQIVLLFPLIMVLHPLEGVFYLLAVLIMSCFRHQYVAAKLKEHWWMFMGALFLLLTGALVLIAKRIVLLPKFISSFNAPGDLYAYFLSCMKECGRLNRFPESFSEIALLSLAAGLIVTLLLRYRKGDRIESIFQSQLTSSIIFFLIPVIPLTFGIVAVFTHPLVVWRFFFCSPWFVILPVFICVILPNTSWKRRRALLLVLIIGIPSAAVAISRHFYPSEVFENKLYCPTELPGRFSSGALFGNVQSLASSFGERGRIHNGIQYSEEDIAALKRIIDAHDVEIEGKKNIFYIRGDMAVIVRGVFRKYVYTRRTSMYEKASFLAREEADKYNLIDIDLPEGFPKNNETFRCFHLDKT